MPKLEGIRNDGQRTMNHYFLIVCCIEILGYNLTMQSKDNVLVLNISTAVC